MNILHARTVKSVNRLVKNPEHITQSPLHPNVTLTYLHHKQLVKNAQITHLQHKSGPEPAILDWHGHCGVNKLRPRGIWGHAPPGKFSRLGTLISLLRPCLGQYATSFCS